jgi:WD40 repeat protein
MIANDGTLRIWDGKQTTRSRILGEHLGPLNLFSVAISLDARWGIACNSMQILVWDLTSCSLRGVMKGHSHNVLSVAISADASLALSASADKTLRVWSLRTGKCLAIFKGHLDIVVSVAISPDESFALSASEDRTLRFWDITSGQCIRIIEGHEWNAEISQSMYANLSNWITSVAISGDASFAALGGGDGKLRILDFRLGYHLRVLEGHAGSINSVIISPDSLFAISTSKDGSLRVWDIASGVCAAILITSPTTSVSFKGDGLLLFTSTDDVHTYRIGNLPLGPFITTASRCASDPDRAPSHATARPVCCGKLIDIPDAIADRIDHWTASKGEGGYKDPALEMPCPHCGTPLKMNPFFIKTR